ncbi:MAG: LPS export ABC transporter periplasmic protein LptC [Oceanobacter sp.]
MKKRLILLILLAVGTGLSLDMVNQFTREVGQNSDQSSENTEADYYGQTLEFRQYSADGQLEQILTATSAEHQPVKDQTRLLNPKIQSPDNNGSWRLQARTSWVTDRDNHIQLEGDVRMNYLDQDAEPMQIRTEKLSYNPTTQVAETNSEVLITSSQIETRSNGMKLDIKRQRMQLLSKVSTRYEQ